MIFIVSLSIFLQLHLKKKKGLSSAGDNTIMFLVAPTVVSSQHFVQFVFIFLVHASQSQTAKTNRADFSLSFCVPDDGEDEDDDDVRGGKSLPLPRPAS